MTTPSSPPPLQARRLLRVRPLWIAPALFGGVAVILMALIYIGSLVNPTAHLHDLPVLLVDQDQGATAPPGPINLGHQVATQLTDDPVVRQRLSIKTTSLPAAQKSMAGGSGYLTIVIPPTFTQSLLQLDGQATPAASTPGLASVQLLTNPRLGSAGVGLATGVATSALTEASQQLGHQLVAATVAADRANPVIAAQLADPITISTVQYRPLPATSALGLSAFYLALLATMCGFLGATLINAAVDSGLGFATTELGPRWRQRRPTPISRWQTLLTKWAMAGVLVPVLTGIVLIVAVGILGLDAPGVGYLWLLMTLSAVTIAVGTLSLLAAFGSVGQLVALILFVYLALASSGATIPIQAIPAPFQLISHVDPLRRTVDGVRAIVYFHGNRHAGWPAAGLVLAIELLFWLAVGAAVSRWYDRRCLSRLPKDLASSAPAPGGQP